MSKKIWRVKVDVKTGEVWCDESRGQYNTTMVPDSACFPVKEAMAYISEIEYGLMTHDYTNAIQARKKYHAAVERMRKKAGRK